MISSSSLPYLPDISTQLYVVWEGLFRAVTSGSYLFKIEYTNGVRFWINGTLAVEAWRCETGPYQSLISRKLIAGSYVKIRMEYFTPSLRSVMIRLKVKIPVGETFFIPGNGYLYYLPTSPFSYTKPRSIYYLGDEFDVNNYLTFGITDSIYSFSINPSLPNGLMLSSGNIVGKVTTTLPKTVFTIKSYMMHGGFYISHVTITIQKVSPPSNIHIEDDTGKTLESISLYRYMIIPTLHLVWEGIVSTWSIYPSLPKDLSFDSGEGLLTGRIITTGSFPITISGKNRGGIASTVFQIDSRGCDLGSFFYTSINHGASGWLLLHNATDVIVDGIVPSGDYGVVVCTPITAYNLEFNCTQSESDCIFRVVREDGTFFFRAFVLYHNLLKSILNLKEKNPPIISTPYTMLYVSIDSDFVIPFTVSNSYQAFAFSPPLPSSLTFDEEKLQITGRISNTGIYTYTVSSSNDIGRSQLKIAVYVGMCPDQEYLVIMNRISCRRGESFEILQNDKSVFQYTFDSSSFSYMLCINHGDYVILLKDNFGRGWVTGSDLVIVDQKNRLIGTFILEAGEEQEVSFPFVELVEEQSSMKCLISTLAPLSSWNSPSFQDQSWSVVVPAQTVSMPGGLATVYFRKHIALTQVSTTFVIISVFVQEGLVVYYQGNELGRVNVPSGTIYHSTTATQSFPEPQWLSYVAMIANQTLEVVVSAELHRERIVSSDNVVFDVHITPSTTSSILRSINPIVEASNHTVFPDHPPAAAFDGNLATSWMDTSLPAWISASSSTQEQFIANQVNLQISKDWNWQVPNVISILGMDELGKTTVLCNISSIALFPYSYTTHSIYFSNSVPYYGYKLVVSSVLSGEAILFTSVAFYYSATPRCPTLGEWASSPAGTVVYLDCTKNHIGKKMRQCVDAGYTGVWLDVNEDGCVQQYPPRQQVFLDFVLKITNCSLLLWNERVENTVIRVFLSVTQQPRDRLIKIVDFENSEPLFVTTAFFRFVLGVDDTESTKAKLEEVRETLTQLVYKEKDLPLGLQFILDGKILVQRSPSGFVLFALFFVLLLIYPAYRLIYWWWNHIHIYFSEYKNLIPSAVWSVC